MSEYLRSILNVPLEAQVSVYNVHTMYMSGPQTTLQTVLYFHVCIYIVKNNVNT